MVLIRRAGAPGILGVLLLVGCGESLFDARGPGGGPGSGPGGRDGGDELGTCNAPCIADASADFDGTPTGKTGHWRYLDDFGNRTWAAMAADGTQMTGNEARNRITTCAGNRDKPACEALPQALLVSSAGAAGGAGMNGADPAIEFTAPSAQVIELRVRAFAPSGDSQQIRLHRNSREDVLFTGVAMPGATLDHTVTLDALAGDRFLVAVAASSPTGGGAIDLGLHLTISSANMAFPSSCQLALAFEVQTGSTVIDLCGSAIYALRNAYGGSLAPLMRGSGPFFEQGFAARIHDGTHFLEIMNKRLDHARDLTVQFWVQLTQLPAIDAVWPFSDLDNDSGSGLGIAITPHPPFPATLDAEVYSDTTSAFERATAPFPDPTRWQFVRVVHTATGVAVCVNGVRAAGLAVPNALAATVNVPSLGSEHFANFAHFEGALDDVRAITGALPCD